MYDAASDNIFLFTQIQQHYYQNIDMLLMYGSTKEGSYMLLNMPNDNDYHSTQQQSVLLQECCYNTEYSIGIISNIG